MKKRNAALDVIKMCLSLFVIIYHQYHSEGKIFNNNFTMFDSWFFNIFVLLIVCPVPLFILISGYLSSFSNKDKVNSFFKLGIDIFIYWIFAILISLILINLLHIKIILINILTFGGRDWWYIWAFLIVKLISPILINGIKKTNKFISLFGIIFFIFIRIFFIKINYSELFNGGSILAFLAIYLIGIWIGVYGKEFLNNKKNYLRSILICLGLMFFGIIFKSFSYLIGFNIAQTLKFGIPLHFVSLVFSICLLNILLKFNLNESSVTKTISKILMPIYLFHFFFEVTLNQIFWSKILIDRSSLSVYDLNFFFAIITWLITLVFSLLIIIPHTFFSKSINKFLWLILNFINEKYRKTKQLKNNTLNKKTRYKS